MQKSRGKTERERVVGSNREKKASRNLLHRWSLPELTRLAGGSCQAQKGKDFLTPYCVLPGLGFSSLAPLFLHHPTLNLLLQPQVDCVANQSCNIFLLNSLHSCQKIVSYLLPASLQCSSLLLTLCSRPDFSFH